ncbi:MAG: metallophosphoesterase family protein [Thermoguttaceae bacterium]|jgi:serine/threonine protein phosphatase 1|nr:metallophosphoesterase family protein [Thermoguttaceae bacterium]
MLPRTIAIGDIHGYSAALRAVLAAIEPCARDTIVTLGDYVDRGPDSRGVLDTLIELSGRCRLVPLLGNHDLLFLSACEGHDELVTGWLAFGGDATLASYGGRLTDVPPEHLNFLRSCRRCFETPRHFFVHASYLEDKPLAEQPDEVLFWESLRDRQPQRHCSGKTAFVGHTAQKAPVDILDLGHLVCIDTWVYGDGWLTALDVDTRIVWRADQNGAEAKDRSFRRSRDAT